MVSPEVSKTYRKHGIDRLTDQSDSIGTVFTFHTRIRQSSFHENILRGFFLTLERDQVLHASDRRLSHIEESDNVLAQLVGVFEEGESSDFAAVRVGNVVRIGRSAGRDGRQYLIGSFEKFRLV